MEPFMELSGLEHRSRGVRGGIHRSSGEAAKALAPIVARQPSVPAQQIAFIEARCDGRLELRLAELGRDPDSQA